MRFETTQDEPKDRGRLWRWAAWGGAGLLFLVPVVAKLTVPGMLWDRTDFIAAALILGGNAAAFDFLSRRGGGFAYRAGAALALIAVFLLVWLNLAVGIIGSEDDPANLLFAGVVAVAVGGACAARFRAAGMARAMAAAAAAQALVLPVVLLRRLGSYTPIWPREVIVLTAFFTLLWLAAAWLYRAAARA